MFTLLPRVQENERFAELATLAGIAIPAEIQENRRRLYRLINNYLNSDDFDELPDGGAEITGHMLNLLDDWFPVQVPVPQIQEVIEIDGEGAPVNNNNMADVEADNAQVVPAVQNNPVQNILAVPPGGVLGNEAGVHAAEAGAVLNGGGEVLADPVGVINPAVPRAFCFSGCFLDM